MDSMSLAKKLLIKENKTLLLLNAEQSFTALMSPVTKIVHDPVNNAGRFDVILLFVSNTSELQKFIHPVMKTVTDETVLWIAYPKGSSGITTDISRDKGWESVTEAGFYAVSLVSLDEKWSAIRFRPVSKVRKLTRKPTSTERKELVLPADFLEALHTNHLMITFEKMAFTHRKEYIRWIEAAVREKTRIRRIAKAVAMIAENKKLN